MPQDANLMTETEIRWVVSHSANCFHAADAIRRGCRPADPSLAAALDEPVGRLRQTVQSLALDEASFWYHLVPLSASIENNTQLVELVLRKMIGAGEQSASTVAPLAGRVADVEAAVRRELPELIDRLTAQANAMAARWQASGPALLHVIGQRTDPRFVVPRADAIVVPEISGGDGVAHLPYNTVRIEAVATDPEPRLPETVRLAWLLAQLNVDLPVFSETIPRDRLPLVAALAMLPPALEAAVELRLLDDDPANVRMTLDTWHIANPGQVDLADVLTTWWASHLEMQPTWNVSLAALERMMDGAVG